MTTIQDHYDITSDVMTCITSMVIMMRVNTEVNTYTRVTQIQWLHDKLALLKAVLKEQQAYLTAISHCTFKGLPQSIDPDYPPKNYKDSDVVSRDAKQEWAEAYDKEYR